MTWWERADCRRPEYQPDLWFPATPTNAGPTSEHVQRQELRAKLICSSCPVRDQCLSEALASGEKFGVWGGLTERERARLACVGARLVPPEPVETGHPALRQLVEHFIQKGEPLSDAAGRLKLKPNQIRAQVARLRRYVYRVEPA